ncbi:AbrB/MazE/SpoVT family DNA-binding domain-containing protein [Candidatus Bipolaricaulota bacterium]|nr:AbrB/MazE/SpoVT family DNA-binding domain-containing protein [Candidatus Bipolaricaulota bacterium]
MSVVKVMQRRQVVIPKELFDKLHLEVGDYLEVKLDEGKLVYVPKKLVDRDEWYFSAEGQKTISAALEDLKAGRSKEFESVDDLIEELDS